MSHRITAVPDAPLTSPRGGPRLAADDAVWALYKSQWKRSMRARNLSPNSIKTYMESYDICAEFMLRQGIESPEGVTSGDIEDLIVDLLGRTRGAKQRSAATAAKDFRQIRVFFNWLAKKETNGVSPMAGMEPPMVEDKPVPVLTDGELRALLDACKSLPPFERRRDTVIIRILLDTGVRRAELAGMTLDDFDLDEQTIWVDGKGRRRRQVAYGARTAEAIDDYLRARAKHKSRHLPSMWLAAPPYSGALGYDGVRLMVERRAKDAGIDGVFLHRFRHTAVDAYLADGYSEGDAMRLFGWTSRKMLDRYGASAANRRALAAARKHSPGDRI